MKFKFNNTYKYPPMESITMDDGIRIYMTPDGPAPSVTTILSTLPTPELAAWKEKVGEDEAKRISKEATGIGSTMHNYLEEYVKNYLLGKDDVLPKTKEQMIAYSMAKAIRLSGLSDLEEIYAIEEALHCYNLYAGRSDLLGIYKGKPSIIDYKSSKYIKEEKYIHHYKLQLSAYALAHANMFGEDIFNQGVLLIGIRPTQYKSAQFQRVIIEEEEFNHYKIEWLDIVADFHK